MGSERFQREVEVTARLNHPHILPLHDSGEADGLLFYVMPYVEGETLRDRIDREEQLPLEDALLITKEVAAALRYAHSHDVIHRDIKPENVLLSAGEAVVADFGIARAIAEAGGERLTETGISIGTPAYMSPEQASGASKLDGRSDIYALGCVLYEMLTGEPPYTGPTAQAVLAKKLSEATPRVSVVRERVPGSVEAAIEQALAKVPADRFVTAEQFVDALDGSTPVTSGAPREKTSRKWGLPAVVALVAVLASVVTVWLTVRNPVSELDPDLVAVFPFRTSGLSGATDGLGEGMVYLLASRFTGEGGPRASSPITTTAAWERAGGSERGGITETDARTIARQLGAGSLILGSIVGSAGRLEGNATLRSTEDGAVLARAHVRNAAGELELADSLATELLALVGGVESRSLKSVMSTSPGALRAYLEGRLQFRRGRFDDALHWFDIALDTDSTFALAGLWLAIADGWAIEGSGASRVRGMRIAKAHSERLSERDNLLLAAWARDGSVPEAEEAARRMPERPEAWHVLGERLYHRGRMLGIDDALERADRAFGEAQRLGGNAAGLVHQMEYAGLMRDTTRFRRAWDAYLALADSVPLWWHWRAATVFGDSVFLAEWPQKMRELSDQGISFGVANWPFVAELGFEDAVAALEILLSRPLSNRQRAVQRFVLSLLLTDMGRPRAVAVLAGQGTPGPLAIWTALLSDGDTARANEAARKMLEEQLAPRPTDEDRLNSLLRNNCALGLWQLFVGDGEGAAATLEAILADDRSIIRDSRIVCSLALEVSLAAPGSMTDRLGVLDSVLTSRVMAKQTFTMAPNMVAARLYERDGLHRRALAAVRRRFTGMILANIFAAARYREEGRLAAILGDTAHAIDAYMRYLNMRYAPEPELQADVDAVRRELRLLVGEPGT